MRICSLLPSGTEILFSLGLGPNVTGVSHECDYPAEAKGLRVLTRCAFDSERLSQKEIDETVKTFARDGKSLYVIDDDALREANPDVIITQDLCHVCAITPDEVDRAVAVLPKRPAIVTLNPSTLDDVLSDVIRVAEACGVDGYPVVGKLQERVKAIAAVALMQQKPRVACLEWLDPLWRTGHWVPGMVELAGATEVLAQIGKPSRGLDWNELASKDPDILIVMPCGCDLIRTREEFLRVREKHPWEDLKAFREGRVALVDANSYFSRPGPRLVNGLELLAELFHQQYFESSAPLQSYTLLKTN